MEKNLHIHVTKCDVKIMQLRRYIIAKKFDTLTFKSDVESYIRGITY